MFFNNIPCICRFFQSVYFGLELFLAIQSMSLSQGWFSSFSFMVVQLLQQCPQSLFWNLFSMLWQLHLEAFAMDHFLPLLLGLCDGRFAYLLPLSRGFSLCATIKVCNFIQAIKKIEQSQWSDFFVLHATSVRFSSNGVKLGCKSPKYPQIWMCHYFCL